ncbi:MAG TPA: GNVR domain-containing protein [Bryobacteraceae bacterium]
MAETQPDFNATLERVWGLLARRRWWILLPASVVAIGTAAYVRVMPNRYQSEATLEVVQQLVSQRYVLATDTASASDVVDAMKREVLSRTRLLGIVDEFNLYSGLRKRLGPEAVAETMRKDVEVDPVDEVPGRSQVGAFKVSFIAETAPLAQAVTTRIISLFIEEHLKTEETRASTTAKFLEDQLDAAQKQLAAQEQRRREFQMQYIGELPQQQQANFAALTDLRTQLQNTLNRMTQAEQQGAALELSLGEKLTRLRAERTALLDRFTIKHPEVIKKDQEIARMAGLLEGLKSGSQASGGDSSLPPSDDPSVPTLVAQVRARNSERQSLEQEENRLKAEIAQYQSRLNLAPVHEQQLAEILRDYDLYSQRVKELQTQLLQAKQTTTITERQVGQQFRLVDPPTLPNKPTSPKRLKIALGGAAAGLLLGIGLAFLLELKDTTFREESAVTQKFDLPLVLSIPLLLTPAEERARRWKRGLEWCLGCAVAIAAISAEYLIYIRT